MQKKTLLWLLLTLLMSPAFANDATEASATGNIVFEKTPGLTIEDETLTITKSANKTLEDAIVQIDVNFHFKNTSAHPITRKIAFVLPPVACREDMRSSWAGLNDDEKTLKDFKTTIDNKPQAFTIRREAMMLDKNVTALLTSLNIPLNPCKIQFTADGKPNIKNANALKQQHLLTEANEPAWTENIYFEWTQTFPAGKIINVHHHYTTTTGGAVPSPRGINELNAEFTGRQPPLTPIWNRQPDTLSSTHPTLVKVSAEDHIKRFCVMPQWVKYNLITGASWQGGIKHFKLIVTDESNAPFAVNQFYGENPVEQNNSGNTMSFALNNFIPKQNVFVQFLVLPQNDQELQNCG